MKSPFPALVFDFKPDFVDFSAQIVRRPKFLLIFYVSAWLLRQTWVKQFETQNITVPGVKWLDKSFETFPNSLRSVVFEIWPDLCQKPILRKVHFFRNSFIAVRRKAKNTMAMPKNDCLGLDESRVKIWWQSSCTNNCNCITEHGVSKRQKPHFQHFCYRIVVLSWKLSSGRKFACWVHWWCQFFRISKPFPWKRRPRKRRPNGNGAID